MSAPPCPRCGSNGLYRDDDVVAEVRVVACRMCGHRIYQGSDPALALTVLELEEKRGGPWRNRYIPAKPLREKSQFTENEENEEQTEKEEEMTDLRFERKRGCSNCRRDKSVQSSGLCNVCQKAAQGKQGDQRVAALAEVKRKIDAGEIQTRVSKHNAAPAPVAQVKRAAPVQTSAPVGGPKRAPFDFEKQAGLALRITRLLTEEAGGLELEVLRTVASLLRFQFEV